MFTLTNERQIMLDAAYAYSFDEPMKPEFELDRYEMLQQYLTIFPEKFRPRIESRTLFQQNELMTAFQTWCEQTIAKVGSEMDASYDKRASIVEKLSPTGRHIYSQSLHDANFLVTEQRGNDFVMLLDTAGGFTVEAIVQLTFTNAVFDGMLDRYYIYDELIEDNHRFGLRILSSGGYPFEEATIWFDDILAKYYYRPSIYVEPNGVETWDEFVSALNADDRYIIVEHNAFVPITLDSCTVTAAGIFAGEHFLGKDFATARERIYCATYENPYAHFSEEVAVDALHEAIFGGDQTMKVRAFNTIFARGEEVADIVNEVLRIAVPDDEEMYFSIMASHFDGLGCLHEDNRQKWC